MLGLLVVAALLIGGGFSVPPARAQDPDEQVVPDIARLEADLEAMWIAALDMPDTDPAAKAQAWSTVLEAEFILDRTRAFAAGGEGAALPGSRDATDRVLERWRRLRPDDAGPDLFRAFEIRGQAEKRRAVLEVLDRYPDDVLAVWQAAMVLRQADDGGRATEVLEGYLARHPERPVAYRLLAEHYDAQGNETRGAEILERWAALGPADPDLVGRWLKSNLPRQAPATTARLLDSFFAGHATGYGALSVCVAAARGAAPTHRLEARACLAQLAAGDDPSSPVAEQAATALVELAAAEDDWPGLLSALEGVAPEARQRAVIAAAYRLEAPAHCAGRIELLSAAARELPADRAVAGSVASSLRACAARPAAQALYLDLVRRVPTPQLGEVIRGWATKLNDAWRGDLPAAAVAPILERRLAEDPDSQPLLAALDIVYQLGDMEEKRLILLEGWQRRQPDSFRGEQAIALAEGLAARGDGGGAIRALERQLELDRFEPQVADSLWVLWLEQGVADRAEGFAATLIAAGEPSRASTGQLLAARSAALRKDFAAAERHYWAHLEGDLPRPEAAVELLTVVAYEGGVDRLPELARRICAETPLGGSRSEPARCASELLTQAGSGEAAAALLAERAADLPDDVRALERLAQTASAAAQWEVAEQALHRILDLDPSDESSWTNLGVFLANRGRLEDLESLVTRARATLGQPPSDLLRAAGRTYLASQQPRRAIDLLREARAALPPGHDPAWIDAELREAYEALGRRAP